MTLGEPVVVPGVDPQDVADRFERSATAVRVDVPPGTRWGHAFSDGRAELWLEPAPGR